MSSAYGIVVEGKVTVNGREILEHEYFCLTNGGDVAIVNGTAVFFVRYGFIGQNQIGGPIEQSGRLVYIDGCSDSLLVYPPRLGDPSLNLLSFPPGINQSFHIHPSIRLGVVISGEGYSNVRTHGVESAIALTPGTAFCLDEREMHRFRTEGKPMIVIAYHPDGDWGPTDQNHTMLNRTYLS